MRDAPVGIWTEDSRASVEMRHSLRELNFRFLTLVGNMADDWNTVRHIGLPAELSSRLVSLSLLQRRAIANCPYALFDLRYGNDDHWLRGVEDGENTGVSDDEPAGPETLEFVRLALFYSWHIAMTAGVAARLLLGMSEVTTRAFRDMTIDHVATIAAHAAGHLTARWCNYPAYWLALTRAATVSNSSGLRRIQLSGLQLAAAVQLRC